MTETMSDTNGSNSTNAVPLAELKHSGLGIASFVLSIVVGLLIMAVLVIAGVIEVSTPGGMDESSVVAVVVGFSMFALMFVDLVAAGLGVGGILQKDRKKIFAILGTLFSVVTFFGTVSLIIVGLMVQ